MPTPGQPCGVVDQTQPSQGLDEVQGRAVELPELRVSLEHVIEEQLGVLAPTGQDQPQVLDGGREVQDVNHRVLRLLAAAEQQVAHVEVAVDQGELGSLQAGFSQLDQPGGRVEVGLVQVFGHHVGVLEHVEGLPAERVRVQAPALLCGAGEPCAAIVNPRHEHAEALCELGA